MISELALDLVEKIKRVPALQNRVGLAIAGGPSDPSMQTVKLPAAWVLFESEQVVRPDFRGYQQEDVNLTFSVALVISYASQSDLINNQLATLEAVRNSVSGADSTNFALKWKYTGGNLVEVSNDRLVYELKFMVSASIQN